MTHSLLIPNLGCVKLYSIPIISFLFFCFFSFLYPTPIFNFLQSVQYIYSFIIAVIEIYSQTHSNHLNKLSLILWSCNSVSFTKMNKIISFFTTKKPEIKKTWYRNHLLHTFLKIYWQMIFLHHWSRNIIKWFWNIIVEFIIQSAYCQ